MVKANAYGSGSASSPRSSRSTRGLRRRDRRRRRGAARIGRASEVIIVFTPLWRRVGTCSGARPRRRTRRPPDHRACANEGFIRRAISLSPRIDTGMNRRARVARAVSLASTPSATRHRRAFSRTFTRPISTTVASRTQDRAIQVLRSRRSAVDHDIRTPTTAPRRHASAEPLGCDSARDFVIRGAVAMPVTPEPVVRLPRARRGSALDRARRYRELWRDVHGAGGRERIATVAAGYADGYPRALSNKVHGGLERCRDASTRARDDGHDDVRCDRADCAIGDVVTLIGDGSDAAADGRRGRTRGPCHRTSCSRDSAARLERRFIEDAEWDRRAAIVVLDGVGIGAAPDARQLRRRGQRHARPRNRGTAGRRPSELT